jgi:hypothetical protein
MEIIDPPHFKSNYLELYPQTTFVDFLMLRKIRNVFLNIFERPIILKEEAAKLCNIIYMRSLFQKKFRYCILTGLQRA